MFLIILLFSYILYSDSHKTLLVLIASAGQFFTQVQLLPSLILLSTSIAKSVILVVLISKFQFQYNWTVFFLVL